MPVCMALHQYSSSQEVTRAASIDSAAMTRHPQRLLTTPDLVVDGLPPVDADGESVNVERQPEGRNCC